ncbi:TRAPP trafficking subunit Trs65-domain-containing protein [Exophiala viscosa]|uniref:TRAPP trafficking subunit Trs65-domain-containing protein n=1 Tax=Exophiala viscosa TaxID=2486360 RepID=A0AAN6IGB1_9EURO|nr:TRAPP trafficking subunit Trs65-domain-containing protein [Exophiala viscosa]
MDADFMKTSLLDTVIPEDTTTELSKLLESHLNGSNDFTRLLPLKERDTLFFDERLRALAVLQVPHCDEDVLKSYLSRLSYKVDVWAIDDSVSNGPATVASTPQRDLIFSHEAIQKNEPLVLASQSTDSDRDLTLIWEIEIALHRPRFRVSQPSIVFVPSATVSSFQDHHQNPADLTPFRPLEANVLEPMRFIPGLQRNPPYLAASRLERVLPVTATHKQRYHIAHVPSRRYRAVPAAIARVRYQRVNTLIPTPTNIALLDVEIVPFVQIDASVQDVHLDLKHGRAESIMPEFFPMQCQSGECLTFIHKLHQDINTAEIPLANPNIDVLSVKIQLQVHSSDTCRPLISMDWTTHVDFTQALNPSFGPPSQPIQRPNRPTSLPVNNGNDSSGPVLLNGTSLQPTSDVLSRDGLSLSFTASHPPVIIGEPFTWKVLVVNNSSKAAKLTVIPLPRIQRQNSQAQSMAKRHAPKSSTASFHPSERRHTRDKDDVDVAQAIVDENVVYAMHHANVVPPETDLMALTAELRIGPLAPGQCHESEIQMIAFEAGSLKVDAMRIVDLVKEAEEGSGALGVVVDIKDLPDIVAVRRADEES